MAEPYGIRFSENKYATKEDVKEVFNMSNVDYIWDDVVDYRKKLAKTLELPSIDHTKFNLVFTLDITNRVIAFERKFNMIYASYSRLSPEAQKVFEMERMLKVVTSISKSIDYEGSQNLLKQIINNSISALPSDLLVVDNYCRALRYIEKNKSETITVKEIQEIYDILESGNINSESAELTYRKENSEEPHYYQQAYIYNNALADRIPAMMNDAVKFINDDKQFASVRAIAILFYIDYIQPYDFMRSTTSTLIFKDCLQKMGFVKMASLINIENLMLFQDKKFLDVKQTVQKTVDITYYFDYVLKFLSDELIDLKEDIEAAEKMAIHNSENTIVLAKTEKEVLDEVKQEQEKIISEARPQETVVEEESSSVPQVQIYGTSQVSIPVFPAGIKDADVNDIVTNLIETYPSLKQTQAHFYATHCTIGKSYTIQQFKKMEMTSYETARTSMDYLTSLGFYGKEKLRNKFLYKPIPRR